MVVYPCRKHLFGLVLLPACFAILAGLGATQATGIAFGGGTSHHSTAAPLHMQGPQSGTLDTPNDTPTITATATPAATGTPVCQVQVASTDVPKNIPDSRAAGIDSTLVISNINTISDIDLTGLKINHNFIHDIRVKLTSPAGTQVLLINQVCGPDANFDTITLDDSASQVIGSVCPPTPGGRYRPQNALAAFNGQPAGGIWTL